MTTGLQLGVDKDVLIGVVTIGALARRSKSTMRGHGVFQDETQALSTLASSIPKARLRRAAGSWRWTGVIAGVGAAVTRDQVPKEARVVDCKGDVVAPGLVDMRAFVGEPGAEHRETIASASAAAAGGVTSLVMRSSATTDRTLSDACTYRRPAIR